MRKSFFSTYNDYKIIKIINRISEYKFTYFLKLDLHLKDLPIT